MMILRPSKQDQEAALGSYDKLRTALRTSRSEAPEIEIEETGQKIKIPLKALELLAEILEATSEGKPVSLVPVATEMTTQAAAELLGCSRPHLVKLLENGTIPFTKVGRHRRVRFEDVNSYREKMKAEQKTRIIDMMRDDEESGLYDS